MKIQTPKLNEACNLFKLTDQLPVEGKGLSHPEELITVIFESPTIRIERIVSNGQTSVAWYDQEESEFVSLLQGYAEITWDDGNITKLCVGDNIIIPAHKLHKVSYTSIDPVCIWLCVFWK